MLLFYYIWLDLLNEGILQIIAVIRGPQKSNYSNFWHNEQLGSFPDPVTKISENVRLKRHPQIMHNISWEIQVIFLILCQGILHRTHYFNGNRFHRWNTFWIYILWSILVNNLYFNDIQISVAMSNHAPQKWANYALKSQISNPKSQIPK